MPCGFKLHIHGVMGRCTQHTHALPLPANPDAIKHARRRAHVHSSYTEGSPRCWCTRTAPHEPRMTPKLDIARAWIWGTLHRPGHQGRLKQLVLATLRPKPQQATRLASMCARKNIWRNLGETEKKVVVRNEGLRTFGQTVFDYFLTSLIPGKGSAVRPHHPTGQ